MPILHPLVSAGDLAVRASSPFDPLTVLFTAFSLARTSRRSSAPILAPGTTPYTPVPPSPLSRFWTAADTPSPHLAHRCSVSDQFCQYEHTTPEGNTYTTLCFSPTISSPTFTSILLRLYTARGMAFLFLLPPHLSLEEVAFALNCIFHSTSLSFAGNPTHLVLLWEGRPLTSFSRSLPGFCLTQTESTIGPDYSLYLLANQNTPLNLTTLIRNLNDQNLSQGSFLASSHSFPSMSVPTPATAPIPPLGTATMAQLNSARLALVLDFARLKTTLPIPTSFGAGSVSIHSRTSLTSPFAPLRTFAIASDGLHTEITHTPAPVQAPAAASSE